MPNKCLTLLHSTGDAEVQMLTFSNTFLPWNSILNCVLLHSILWSQLLTQVIESTLAEIKFFNHSWGLNIPKTTYMTPLVAWFRKIPCNMRRRVIYINTRWYSSKRQDLKIDSCIYVTYSIVYSSIISILMSWLSMHYVKYDLQNNTH